MSGTHRAILGGMKRNVQKLEKRLRLRRMSIKTLRPDDLSRAHGAVWGGYVDVTLLRAGGCQNYTMA